MYIVVGLGNPGGEYKRTYHNMGYVAVEELAILLKARFNVKGCNSIIAKGKTPGGEDVILAKPLTYMNLSGDAVHALARKYKAKNSEILVLFDDFDLPKGRIRVRGGGTAGTHNGIKDIVAKLGSTDFARVKIGTHGDCGDLKDYVLGDVSEDEYNIVIPAIKEAALAALDFISGVSIEDLQQKYNGYKA